MTRFFAGSLIMATLLTACAAPPSSTGLRLDEVRALSDEEKIRRAAAILGEIPVGGYCREVPRLTDVLREPNCCGFVRKIDAPAGTAYASDPRGEIVEIRYRCTGPDGGRYLAAHSVDLETGATAPSYPDANARHIEWSGSDSFPDGHP